MLELIFSILLQLSLLVNPADKTNTSETQLRTTSAPTQTLTKGGGNSWDDND